MSRPKFQPANPVLTRSLPAGPFTYELKHDGFRALAHITAGGCELVSRRGNVYKSFRRLSAALATLGGDAMLDGELVVLDSNGRSQFYELLRGRTDPVFYAFGCLSLDDADLRTLPLLERKTRLRAAVKGHPSVLFARHVANGPGFFRLICEQDLEGMVARRRDATYGVDRFKILNPNYSQRLVSCPRSS